MKKITDNIVKDLNGCWVWQKSCSSSGYGQFTKGGVYWNTHRYVWTMLNGEIPEGKLVRHICHNKKCSNPDHLLLGNNKDNYNDSLDTYKEINKKRRFEWIINGTTYKTSREAVDSTGVSMDSVIKFTDKKTRIFDVGAYRKATVIAGWKPKV